MQFYATIKSFNIKFYSLKSLKFGSYEENLTTFSKGSFYCLFLMMGLFFSKKRAIFCKFYRSKLFFFMIF